MADEDDSKDPKPPAPDEPKGDGDDADAPPADDRARPHGEGEPPAEDYGQLYETHMGRLIAIARDDFGVEERRAVDLAQTILTSLLHASPRVSNVPEWLTGAIRFAAEAYVLRGVLVDWGRRAAVPSDLTLPNGVRWRDIADRLTPRFLRLLELRYVEGHTVAEMADLLGTTESHVETLLELCLRQTEKYAPRRSGASG